VGRITVTNLDTGLVLAAWNTGGLVGSAVTAAPDGTNIRVDIVVTDPNTGIVVDSRSATATTPAPRVKTT